MPLYKAYGELTSHGATRTPFLLDLSGTTPVALVDTATAPDLNIKIEIQALTEPGGAATPGSGLGVRAYIQPVAGRILTDLRLRLVIWPSADADAVTEGTNPHPGNIDFVALEYRTPGTDPLPLVVLEVGQLAKVHTTLDATAPADIRIDDEYKVEACTPDGMQTLHLVGRLVTAPLHIFPGRRINPTGVYGEHNTSIQGIDLARVLPAPPPTAASPVSATWFDVTAAAPSTAPPPGTYTHLKITARQPHAAPAPTTAPAAAAGGAGLLLAGSYTYAVAFAHANGNETPLGPASPPVVVPANGSVQVSNIPAGPAAPAANPEYAVVARHLYRAGPDGGDPLLVGVLAGPSTPTTFLDRNDPIPVGGAVTIAAGEFRPASRLSVRYSADSALHLDGEVVLVSTGLGSNAVDHYHGTVSDAPTSVLVVKDDQTGLRATLQPATHDRSRLRWSAPTRTPQVTVSVPGISTPFGTGADVRVDDVPPVFGFDWRSLGDLLTTLDIRATDDLTPFPDVVPPVASGTPGLIGRAAVRLGPGQPAATWPEAEATVGGEVHDGDQVNAFGAIAVRGLRWVALQLGTGTSDAAGRAEVHGRLLLGDDPSRPPGHDRGLRVLRERRSSAGAGDSLRWWARAGVLPDLLAMHYTPFDTTPATDVVHTEKVVLEGVVERVVVDLRDGTGLLTPDDPTGLRVWGSLVTTGHNPDGKPSALTAQFDRPVDPASTETTSFTLDAEEGLHAEASIGGVPVSSRPAVVNAQLRVPRALQIDSDTSLTIDAGPDDAWGRAGITWAGNPVVTRANPEVRMRTRPNAPAASQVESVTTRLLGLSLASLTQTSIPSVARTRAKIDFGARNNRSFRFEEVEIDTRVQPAPRTVWKARAGLLPDQLSGEMHTNTDPGGSFFFAKVATNEPITGGVVWAEPAQFRMAGDPRGELAGIGNVAATLDTVPVALELVLLDKVPASHSGDADYAGGETLPMVHPVSTPAAVGGARVRFGGPLMASDIRLVSFAGDAAVCLNGTPGLRSSWTETIVPLLNVAFDDMATITDPVADHTFWYWTPESPPPTPPSGPPANPCSSSSSSSSSTKDTAFRIAGGLLVDVAYRDYALQDLSTRTFSRWDGFTAVDDVNGDHVGTWKFTQELQMKGYRGEITIALAPGLSEKLGNPYGDWQAGPGHWYLRARDKLEIVVYTGDLYMGNTGGGFHVPLTNGIFSTLPAIFNITWP